MHLKAAGDWPSILELRGISQRTIKSMNRTHNDMYRKDLGSWEELVSLLKEEFEDERFCSLDTGT